MKLQSKHLKDFSLSEYISKTEDIKDYVDNTFIPLDGRSVEGSIAINNEDETSKLPGAIATGNGSIAVGSEFCNQTQINITAEELDELDLTTVNVGTKYYLTSSGILHKIILKSDEVKENQYVRWSQYDSFMWKILDLPVVGAQDITVDELNSLEVYEDNVNKVYRLTTDGQLTSFFIGKPGMTFDVDMVNDEKTIVLYRSRALAYGNGSVAFGSGVALNENTVAYGAAQAYGYQSHAEGGDTTRSVGSYSHAEGADCQSYGIASHAEGHDSQAYGSESHAEGQSMAFANASHSEGYKTEARSPGSHAEGAYSKTFGQQSHAEGYRCETYGQYSHAEGFKSVTGHKDGDVVVPDDYAFCWNGDKNNAYYSHNRGTFNINPANGVNGFFVGENTLCSIISSDIASLSSKSVIDETEIIFEKQDLVLKQGYIMASNGFSPSAFMKYFTHTDYIPVDANTKFKYYAQANNGACTLAFYKSIPASESETDVRKSFVCAEGYFPPPGQSEIYYATNEYVDMSIRLSAHPEIKYMRIGTETNRTPIQLFMGIVKKIDNNTVVYHNIGKRIDYLSSEIFNSNVLYGKKYLAIGDSFTQGYFENYVDKSGKKGKQSDAYDPDTANYKTYPWHIMKRNNMQMRNVAAGGGTMHYNPQDPFNFSKDHFCTRLEALKNEISSSDYITIAYGLNEEYGVRPISILYDVNSNKQIKDKLQDPNNSYLSSYKDVYLSNLNDPVYNSVMLSGVTYGDATSTDLSTINGAWNTTLKFILENNPTVKIGIIINDGGINQQHHDTLVDISKRWGIPYLDMCDDPKVPVGIRGRLHDLCDEAKEIRNAAFTFEQHPNLAGHYARSTYIENFMRSL